MEYQVMECRYNYNPDDADKLFATNDRQEAIEAAREFGAGTVVLQVINKGNNKKNFSAPYETNSGIKK